ncbi:hypothetical protein DMA11_20080 [Marinilabiliaceae bacterium JC017]|nr:hypothetical protein DMA11_20080 [Marinilabiliaceae bacterium JC017]
MERNKGRYMETRWKHLEINGDILKLMQTHRDTWKQMETPRNKWKYIETDNSYHCQSRTTINLR